MFNGANLILNSDVDHDAWVFGHNATILLSINLREIVTINQWHVTRCHIMCYFH